MVSLTAALWANSARNNRVSQSFSPTETKCLRCVSGVWLTLSVWPSVCRWKEDIITIPVPSKTVTSCQNGLVKRLSRSVKNSRLSPWRQKDIVDVEFSKFLCRHLFLASHKVKQLKELVHENTDTCRAIPPRPCLGSVAIHDTRCTNRFAVHQGMLD
jgi:hypothetical protein